MSSVDAPLPPRCVLFFPGSRPDRYAKAIASGADRVCLDLEDAVEPAAKDDARRNAVALVGGEGDPSRLVIRINHPETRPGEADLEALGRAFAAAEAQPAIMVPKVSGPADLESVAERLASRGRRPVLIAMIETARGLGAVERIAGAPHVWALLLGGVDLSAELGCSLEWDALLYARSRIVHAAALAGVGAIDYPWLDAADAEGLLDEATAVRGLGFRGKAAIHPSQVATIQSVFRPTAAEIERARRVVEAATRHDDGAFLLDGVLVDRPIVEAARRVLARAEAGR